MKKILSLLSLATLTVGLLGSCSKINERIDGVEKRVESIENEKIASIENQIAAINSSIADLGQIRSDINSLKQSAVNHGQDIFELQEADETLKNRIDNLEDYLDGTLTKFAEKDWAIATFATLERLDSTKKDLSALEGKVNKLGETFDGKLSDLKTNLTNSINSAINGVNASISTLEARVSALEAMIQSVSITPAYSDGSVESVDGILTLKCIVSPAEALIGMESLKDSLLIYADSVKVKTKATTPAYMTIEVSEASVLDAAQGAITLKADISKYLPKGEDKALTVALHIKNGISHFTTEFVPVTNTTFKAVYNTNGGANTLTFYFDANGHSGEGTVYDNLPTAATAYTSWGYNGILGNIKSVKIDPSVAGYQGLTSTAYMFFNMTEAESISGAEYLDVSNVKDMTGMFYGYGRNSASLTDVPVVSGWKTDNVEKMGNLFSSYGQNSTSLTAPPDVSMWNTGKVTDMSNMFSGYGQNSTSLTAVPDVSGWKTDNVTKMGTLFAKYGDANKNNINCVLDLTGWNLANLAPQNNVFYNFSPNIFKVTIPAKTGENANLPLKWYGSGTFFFAPPTDKTFTPALAGVFSVSATKKVHFSQGNLYYNGSKFDFEANQYDIQTSWSTSHVSHFFWSKSAEVAYAETYSESSTSETDVFFTNATTETAKSDFTVNGVTGKYRTLSRVEWQYLFNNHSKKWATVHGVNGYVIAPDGFAGTLSDTYADDAALAAAGNLVFLPAAGSRNGSSFEAVGDLGFYWSSSADEDNEYALNVSFGSNDVSTGGISGRDSGFSVRLVTEVK